MMMVLILLKVLKGIWGVTISVGIHLSDFSKIQQQPTQTNQQAQPNQHARTTLKMK